MLDLQQLKTFMAVVATMSFSRAADQLDYSQSSVTHHIKGLERELGVRLFNRFRFARKIALTDAGRRVYLYAARLLALAEEAKVAVRPKQRKRGGHKKGAAHKPNDGPATQPSA